MRKTVLITLGPTREYFDRVRFISNASSGQQGKYLAEEFLRRNWRVIVVAGAGVEPLSAKKIIWKKVISARQMLNEVKKYQNKARIIIGAAAVSDYRPEKVFPGKIRSNKKKLKLILTPNPDILKIISNSRRQQQMIVGFALEEGSYRRQLQFAQEKLVSKKLDLIVLNPLSSMEASSTTLTVIFRNGRMKKFSLLSKQKAAKLLTDAILRYYQKLN